MIVIKIAKHYWNFYHRYSSFTMKLMKGPIVNHLKAVLYFITPSSRYIVDCGCIYVCMCVNDWLGDENVFPSKYPGQEEAFPRQLTEEEKCIPFRRKPSMDSIKAYDIYERSSICSQIIAFTPSC